MFDGLGFVQPVGQVPELQGDKGKDPVDDLDVGEEDKDEKQDSGDPKQWEQVGTWVVVGEIDGGVADEEDVWQGKEKVRKVVEGPIVQKANVPVTVLDEGVEGLVGEWIVQEFFQTPFASLGAKDGVREVEVVVVEDEGQEGAAQEREEKQLEESLGAGEVEGVEEVVEAQEDAVGSVERGEGEAGGGEQGVDGEKEPAAADVAVEVVRDGELAGVDAEKGQGKGEGFGVDGGEEAGGAGEDE